MRETSRHPVTMPISELDWEIDTELFDPPFDTRALEVVEASVEDVEPWQRLGDLLGRITGEADTE